MRYAKVISVMMAVLLMLGLLPGMSTTASAANATTRYNGGDTDYAILNLYVDKGDSAGDATVYGTVNQGGEQLDQDGFVKTNISVPLKEGDNTVVVTCGLGMKGGTSDQRYEQYHNALSNISWFRNLSVRGGVTLSATQIDPMTVADAPIPSTVLQAEDYGVITGPEVSGSLVSVPSTQEYRDGAGAKRHHGLGNAHRHPCHRRL